MQINLIWDSNALAAPSAFRATIQAAANLLDATFRDNIQVNISVGYGEIDGNPEPSGGASAGPATGLPASYASLRALMLAEVAPDVTSGVNALPTGSAIQGSTTVEVWSAEAKALGLMSPTNSALDGASGFATDISTTDALFGVALHELTHAMGRVPDASPDVFDLYRYTGLGNLLFEDVQPATPAYFSLDGGITDLADYGINSDPSDYLNSSVRTPNDAFNEFYTPGSTDQFLTRVDILQMEALGFHATDHSVGDFHDSGATDILWQNANNSDVQLWKSTPGVGPGLGGTQDVGAVGGWQVQQIADLNGDGRADLIWRYSNGDAVAWNSLGTGSSVAFNAQDLGVIPLSWSLIGSGDFGGSGHSDLVWQNSNGDLAIWYTSGSGGTISITAQDLGVQSTPMQLQGVGAFNGDGVDDLLWRNTTTGDLFIWNAEGVGTSVSFTTQDVGVVGAQWQVQGVGDFNNDGKADILFRNTSTGDVVISESTPGVGDSQFNGQDFGVVPTSWHIEQVGDFNGDGKADILWQNTNGDVVAWLNATGTGGVHFVGQDLGVQASNWHILSDWHF